MGTIEGVAPCDHLAWRAIEEIFFLCASQQSFSDEKMRREFLRRWTDYYRHQEIGQILLYRQADRQIVGYLTGCLDSSSAEPLYRDIGSYQFFDTYFDRFPAHFHVNCHPMHSSRGVRPALVHAFLKACRAASLSGAHVVAAAGARNVAFYQRLGFEPIEERDFEGTRRLLLGLGLDRPSQVLNPPHRPPD